MRKEFEKSVIRCVLTKWKTDHKVRTYQELIKGDIYKESNDNYEVFTAIFRQVLDKHAPLKRRKIRGN